MADRTVWERVEAGGTRVLDALKTLIAEGNVRRVRVKQQDRVVAEFPLTIGVIGTLLAPVVAAIGAITALLTDCSVEVERVVPASKADPDEPAAAAPGNPDDDSPTPMG